MARKKDTAQKATRVLEQEMDKELDSLMKNKGENIREKSFYILNIYSSY